MADPEYSLRNLVEEGTRASQQPPVADLRRRALASPYVPRGRDGRGCGHGGDRYGGGRPPSGRLRAFRIQRVRSDGAPRTPAQGHRVDQVYGRFAGRDRARRHDHAQGHGLRSREGGVLRDPLGPRCEVEPLDGGAEGSGATASNRYGRRVVQTDLGQRTRQRVLRSQGHASDHSRDQQTQAVGANARPRPRPTSSPSTSRSLSTAPRSCAELGQRVSCFPSRPGRDGKQAG